MPIWGSPAAICAPPSALISCCSRLAALIVIAGDAESVDFAARALSRAAPQLPGVTVLGPAPAPLAVLRGRHRRRFLVKAGRDVKLQAVLRGWLSRVRVQGSAR